MLCVRLAVFRLQFITLQYVSDEPRVPRTCNWLSVRRPCHLIDRRGLWNYAPAAKQIYVARWPKKWPHKLWPTEDLHTENKINMNMKWHGKLENGGSQPPTSGPTGICFQFDCQLYAPFANAIESVYKYRPFYYYSFHFWNEYMCFCSDWTLQTFVTHIRENEIICLMSGYKWMIQHRWTAWIIPMSIWWGCNSMRRNVERAKIV